MKEQEITKVEFLLMCNDNIVVQRFFNVRGFNKNSSISCFRYRTYMNNAAISPHIFMYALQNQNVERKIAKQIDIKHLNTNITSSINNTNITSSINTDINNTNVSTNINTNITSDTNINIQDNTTNISDILPETYVSNMEKID